MPELGDRNVPSLKDSLAAYPVEMLRSYAKARHGVTDTRLSKDDLLASLLHRPGDASDAMQGLTRLEAIAIAEAKGDALAEGQERRLKTLEGREERFRWVAASVLTLFLFLSGYSAWRGFGVITREEAREIREEARKDTQEAREDTRKVVLNFSKLHLASVFKELEAAYEEYTLRTRAGTFQLMLNRLSSAVRLVHEVMTQLESGNQLLIVENLASRTIEALRACDEAPLRFTTGSDMSAVAVAIAEFKYLETQVTTLTSDLEELSKGLSNRLHAYQLNSHAVLMLKEYDAKPENRSEKTLNEARGLLENADRAHPFPRLLSNRAVVENFSYLFQMHQKKDATEEQRAELGRLVNAERKYLRDALERAVRPVDLGQIQNNLANSYLLECLRLIKWKKNNVEATKSLNVATEWADHACKQSDAGGPSFFTRGEIKITHLNFTMPSDQPGKDELLREILEDFKTAHLLGVKPANAKNIEDLLIELPHLIKLQDLHTDAMNTFEGIFYPRSE